MYPFLAVDITEKMETFDVKVIDKILKAILNSETLVLIKRLLKIQTLSNIQRIINQFLHDHDFV